MKRLLVLLAMILFTGLINICCNSDISEPNNSKKHDTIDNHKILSQGESETVPSRTTLFSPYPNPCNPATTIQFGIPAEAFVTIVLQNPSGDVITTLLSEEKEAGIYALLINVTDFVEPTNNDAFFFISLYTNDYSASKLIHFKR